MGGFYWAILNWIGHEDGFIPDRILMFIDITEGNILTQESDATHQETESSEDSPISLANEKVLSFNQLRNRNQAILILI